MTAPLTFSISAERLDDFCRQVRVRERSSSEALRILTTLQAFTAAFASSPEITRASHTLLEQHCEILRDSILEEAAAAITTALIQQSIAGISACYTRLSRSGFSACAVMALEKMDPKQREATAGWIRQWLAAVKEKSGQFPDAVDFRSAGVDPKDYLAITDLVLHL